MQSSKLSFSEAVALSKKLRKKSFFANPFYLHHNCFYEEKNRELVVFENSKIDGVYPLLFLPDNPENVTNAIISTGFDEDISVIEKTHALKSKEVLGYEYFYATDEWISLEGLRFEANRKQVRKFQKDHDLVVSSAYDHEAVLAFLEEWALEKRKKEVSELTKHLFEQELQETMDNLTLIDLIEHKKLFVEENNELLGFSIFFPFFGDLWIALIQKSKRGVQGLSRYFYHAMAKEIGEGKILLTGAEAQDPGLKAFKENLKPIEVKPVYILRIGTPL